MLMHRLRPEARLFLDEPRRFVLPNASLTTRQRLDRIQYRHVMGPAPEMRFLDSLKDHFRWLRGRFFKSRSGRLHTGR